MNKSILIIITLGLVVVLGIVFSGDNIIPRDDQNNIQDGENIEIKGGVQYITINARGGYFPSVTNAEAGIPTKLIMKTSGAFDCSSALVIRSLNYQKMLPPTGETEIDLGIPQIGEPLQGLCSMGMYNFTVNFE